LSGETIPEKRLAETITANILAVINGAAIIRVHDVAQAVKAMKILKTLSG
jgi:dihydropteroate synthase